MHRLFIILIVIGILSGGVWYIVTNRESFEDKYIKKIQEVDQKNNSNNIEQNSQTTNSSIVEKVTVIAQGLDTPWAIAFLPDGKMLVTERSGRVKLIESEGSTQNVAILSQVKE